MLEVSNRLRAGFVCAVASLFVAAAARAELSPQLAAAIAQTQGAYPALIATRSGDRFLASVDDAELARLVARIAAGQWDASTEAATWVVLDGFARDQGPAAAYGRSLTSQIAGSAAAGGNLEAVRGMARILDRFLADESHAYSILAQGLLSEKIRCGAASLGDDDLVRRITAEVNPDRAFKLGATDGTVADRYDLHRRADLFSIAATGERVAAAGYFGTVIVSRDGGQTWDAPQTGTDEPLYAVALGPGDEVWAAGRAGVVIHSEDGGRSFTRRTTPFDRHVFGLYAGGPGELLAVGDYGLQLRTHDAGAHWACIPREQDIILGRIARAGDDAVVAGEFGTLERIPAGLPPGVRGTLAGVPEDFYVFDVWFDASGRLGVAVGLGGAIVRSEDGGATWARVATPFTQDLFGVGGSGARVAVSGEGGLVLVSDDAGRTFRAAEVPKLPVTLTDVEFADAEHAYAVGPRGLVLRSDDGGASFRVLRGERLVSVAERFSRFFARQRNWFAFGIAAITIFFAFQLRHLEIYTQYLDLLPRAHPFIHTYEAYRDIYGNANTVVAAIVPREGDIYRPEILRAIARLTELMDSSVVDAEVNAKPTSAWVEPRGIVGRGVHALVSLADRVVRSPVTGGAETGVDHNLVTSLTHRTARDARVRLDGTLYSPALISEAIPETPEELANLRERVRRNPSVFGVLVAVDERAALVRASFVETRLDYGALFKHMQAAKKELEANYPVEVFLTGQPLLFGWTYAFATEILLVFALTLVVSVGLLWGYFRRVYGVFLPMSGAFVNVIWGLGFAAWAGYNLDPLVLVVPMLITARAISHSVQFVERFYEEYEALGDKDEACIRSMAELLLPGTLGILTDCIGLLTIALATIPMMHKLGLLCAFWAASIVVTEMLLNRLLILYLPAPRERRHFVLPLAARTLGAAARLVGTRGGAIGIVVVFALVTVVCGVFARDVPVGEHRPGTPILYPDADFNVAAREIGTRFFGLDDLLVVAHGSVPGRVYAPDSFKLIESLQRALETDENAGGSISLVDLQKQTSRLFHNDDPRWAMWMQTTAEISGISYLMETSVPAPGILDPYRSQDSQSLAIRVFYRDHRAPTVEGAIERLERFANDVRLDGSLAIRLRPGEPDFVRRLGWINPILPPVEPRLEIRVDGGEPELVPGERWEGPDGLAAEVRHSGWRSPYELWVRTTAGGEFVAQPSGTWLRDGVELRYAAGSIGVLAASIDEIGASSDMSLVIVFVTTFLVVLISYRSFLIATLLTASLATASLAALAVQAIAGIAIDVNTLPVQAIGVGLGIDYGLYLVDRVLQERPKFATRVEAVQHAIRTTGLAIGFTASTLLVGIMFWIPISSLRFSAEMSLLLSILMGVNALAAILLVPAMIVLLPDRWAGKLE